MRDIKFRAWDERNKIMHFDFQFIKLGDSGNDWIVFASDKHSVKEKIFSDPFFSQQLKIMQYTGLYDKNGKEIYEGDILRDGNDLYNYVVIFDEYNGMFKRRKISEYPIEKTLARNYEYKDGNATINLKFTFEIIGNIYKNPELIK